jgi:AraC-like DNA-binding protein
MQNSEVLTPYDFFHFDFFAGLILIGAFQGAFLFILLVSKPKQQPFNTLFLAILVFSVTSLLTEKLLGYSGLITKTLFLVGFSEPFTFVIGPAMYLLIRSMAGEMLKKKDWLHFLPFLLYFFYHLPFLMESDVVKYNAFLGAFHPDIPSLEAFRKFTFDDPLYLRRNLSYFLIFQRITYIILACNTVNTLKNRDFNNPYFSSWMRFFLGSFVVAMLFFITIKLNYQKDMGDHFMAAYISVWLFFFSYKLLKDSNYFQPVVKLKYEKSSLNEQNKQDILRKLKLLEQSEFYIDPFLSLAKLAKQIGTSPHYLSQVLNDALNKTYFEYIRHLRIEKAQKMLLNPANSSFNIEKIAEKSGYLSLSAFYTAFKAITGTSPREFEKSAEHKNSYLYK